MILIYVKLVQKKKEKVNIMAAVERNSDGSYDAVDSGGFGKDYHGQDAFGERIGSVSVGGDGHESSFDAPEIDTTELSNTESSFEGEAETQDALKDLVRSINEEAAEENSNTGSMDTSFQIGGTEEEDAKKDEKEKTWASSIKDYAENVKNNVKEAGENAKNNFKDIVEKAKSGELPGALKDLVKNANENAKDNVRSGSFFNDFGNDIIGGSLETLTAPFRNRNKKGASSPDTPSFPDTPTDNSDWEEAKSSFDVERAKEKEEEEKAKSSFTDKMEESKTEEKAEPGTNMSSAKTSPSDYLTKANKDSTKELPKEGPSRNDFGNHAANTLKGVVDRIADNSTAKALGLKSVEEFARENGYDPDKLSTMKAYQKYQNEQIMKAIPKVTKKVGGYIMERIKDAFDPSQLPERIRNTLARYNPATLIGAAILSIQSGAGIQASIDQALTMVDPEDQPDVSDFLEDALKDRDTVKDLSNAIDDALAPEENSNTSEIDESIVNIGRKDNTDYDDFNAGLGTTSDADVKVFIARNIKEDPILRKMVSKIGK